MSSSTLPSTYRAAVIDEAGADLVVRDLPLRAPGPGEVLVRVRACGVCHSDHGVQHGLMGNPFPRVPGHEMVGDVAAVGAGVTRFAVGARVGGAWHGGHDGTCRSCSRGFFQTCDNETINGVLRDGGYAEYVLLREEAAVRLPADADPVRTAPLLCAGVTVFNGLRQLQVPPGALVAVQGLGGLGHLAVQYARRMGYRVAALSSGSAKREFATRLGAHAYIDTSAAAKEGDAATQLRNLEPGGGADVIVATAPDADALAALVAGLAPGGKLLVLAPLGPVALDTTTLVLRGASVHGWPAGHAVDCEDAVRFAADHGVECLVEEFALADAQRALEHCVSGNVRFRGVLVL